MLKLVFIIDAVLAVSFGIYSWIFPHKTFGTIISIPEVHSSVFLAILSSLSLFYILVGLTCLIGAKATSPINLFIGILMVVRHFFEGVIKIDDLEEDWLIGNPYPDLIIHSVFIIVYVLAIYYAYKSRAISK